MKLLNNNSLKIRRRIESTLLVFMVCLILSGVTAFPIESQLGLATRWIEQLAYDTPFTRWIGLVYQGVRETNLKFPFIAYGTDWLAFAHLVIAVAFIGPLRDPRRNIWVVEFGMIACLAVLPMAFIAGEVREIPFFWRLIDCMFGLVGGLALWRCHRDIKQLERIS
ncbi:MAG TPA: hypothetical protein VFO54_02300 [Chryseosolibacter sp.]|nr:hypothetical protein [Chryseosolibacter sp.]